jgi:Putative beta-barrel porin-2, OmpL-like. bbp2
MFDCCLGDPCTLKDHLTPCCSDYNYGGWVALGYYTDPTRFSTVSGDGLAFNDYPDHLNLTQAWVYFEKVASASACCADYGYRFDMLYGTDAQKTQAFGNPINSFGTPDGWDNPWDDGVYGWAIPQLYGEVAYGDWSVKAGHFFTTIGYEVVPAPDNFFFSHALTMFNAEPFTHTGVLATYSGMDKVTVYGGWTLGWDTGFDQFGSGSSWLGGVSVAATDDVTFTYMSTAGNLGWRSNDQDGYSQSLVGDVTMSDNVEYVIQSDYVQTQSGFYAIGVNQYLFYTVSDCLKAGGRFEWFKTDNFSPNDSVSYYEATLGVNYKPHANVVVRPEVRWDWTNAENTINIPNYDETVFAIDAIFTF